MDKKRALEVLFHTAQIYLAMMRDEMAQGPEGVEIYVQEEYDEIKEALEVLHG